MQRRRGDEQAVRRAVFNSVIRTGFAEQVLFEPRFGGGEEGNPQCICTIRNGRKGNSKVEWSEAETAGYVPGTERHLARPKLEEVRSQELEEWEGILRAR